MLATKCKSNSICKGTQNCLLLENTFDT